uniref:Cytochrome b561 domain-containing protein n=1 Tax=Salix viminalis TaxID=40686 RepID=A0A6N2KLW3_SALVM
MQLLQKLVSFIICANLVILLLLPLVSSSQEHLKTTGNLTSSKNIIPKSSPKLLFEITFHGFLLWVSMGFLMPVGLIAIRMSHREACGRRLKILFYVHSISQAEFHVYIE